MKNTPTKTDLKVLRAIRWYDENPPYSAETGAHDLFVARYLEPALRKGLITVTKTDFVNVRTTTRGVAADAGGVRRPLRTEFDDVRYTDLRMTPAGRAALDAAP